jgi:hypothetical protein
MALPDMDTVSDEVLSLLLLLLLLPLLPLLLNLHQLLLLQDCIHFDFGDGTCPFGTSCFYRHAYRDGRLEVRVKPLRQHLSLNWLSMHCMHAAQTV